jgi:ABC-type nitrate/sulfonate/bicarbonate transport system substrate-binding protein
MSTVGPQVHKLLPARGWSGRTPGRCSSFRRSAGIAVALSLLTVACGRAAEPASQPSPQPAVNAGTAAPVVSGTAVPQARPLEPVRIAAPSISLAYLPAHLAWALGYFREEGLDVEFPQLGGPTVIPALLGGDIDFAISLSAIAANAGQGGPTRIVQFHSVRLQNVLSVRPEITHVSQLAGKRVAVQSLGTLTAFWTRKVADHYGVPDVAILAFGGDLERIAGLESGAADAAALGIPSNVIAEKHGYPTLLRASTILEIPQAGLGTSEAILRDQADRVERTLRAAARMLPVIASQRDLVVQQIAEWVELSPEDAARAYDQVADTFSPNGLATDAQLAAYMELMYATAGVPTSVPPSQLVDFTIARRVAAELGLPNP